jgi:hypothetical protein
MNTSPDMSDIIGLMHEYQAKNNVTNQCITNTQYLYDSILHSNWPNKVIPKAVVVVYTIPEKNEAHCVVHMVVQWKDKLLEPSYQFGHLQKTYYFDNINNAIKALNSISPGFTREDANTLISKYLKFIKYAEQIQAGAFLVDREYYDLQADYVEGKLEVLFQQK